MSSRLQARLHLWPASLLVLAGVAAYGASFSGPFILDDLISIVGNPSLRAWGTAFFPPVTSGFGGRPVLNLSFALNYALAGESPGSYHALNLAIHLLAALALFGVVRRLIARRGDPERAVCLGAAVALFWELHPLLTEAVTYVSGRAEALMGLFYLLMLYGFVRFTEPSGGRRWAWLAFASCFLGMATKEVMVTAPLIVLLVDRTFVAGSFALAWKKRRAFYLGLASSWILLVVLLRGITQRGAAVAADLPWWKHWATNGWAVVHYLRLAFWPRPLVFDYGMATARLPPAAVLDTAGVAVLFALTLVALWRRPVWGFFGAWLFITLAPTTSFVPLASQPVAEHRMYLPLVILVVGAVLVGDRALARLPGRGAAAARGAAVLALALIFGVMTWARNADYRSAWSIWHDTVAKDPASDRALNNLALLEVAQHRIPEAVAHYETALRLNPRYADAENNLGVACYEAGDLAKADFHARRALWLKPGSAVAEGNLGVFAAAAGRSEEAMGHYRHALQLDGNYPDAHYNLAVLLAGTGKKSEAIPELESALRLRPGFTAARNRLALLWLEQGRTDAAIAQLTLLVRQDPASVDGWINLGNAFRTAGQPARALGPYRTALRLAPIRAGIHNNLAVALFQSGRREEAVAEFIAALRLDPEFAEARKNLETVRTELTQGR